MNNRRLHINRIFATLLLWVFAIALTPWSSLHHHEEQSDYCAKSGKECMHKVHVGSERHNCLICSAHFEKDYYTAAIPHQAKPESKATVENHALTGFAYTALISTSLRGPPIA